VVDRSPVCPLHRKPMPRVETGPGEPYHKCSQPECPIHWNPEVTLFYLKTSGDWPLRERGNED
jgi:hypothetical protein